MKRRVITVVVFAGLLLLTVGAFLFHTGPGGNSVRQIAHRPPLTTLRQGEAESSPTPVPQDQTMRPMAQVETSVTQTSLPIMKYEEADRKQAAPRSPKVMLAEGARSKKPLTDKKESGKRDQKQLESKEDEKHIMYDGPELAARQEFESTKDPATGTVPRESRSTAMPRTS